MDAHDYARLASLLADERSAVGAALARYETHQIGTHWQGRTRHQAGIATNAAIEACHRSLSALAEAETEARRLWRRAIADGHFLGV
jgi:predicted alpha/beta-hydrolase family hydrolase